MTSEGELLVRSMPRSAKVREARVKATTETPISVILPVHNGGVYLLDAVNSILGQEGVYFELVVIDDHSTDESIQALPKDPRIKVLASTSRGIVPALNQGIANAKYPLIARMDGDDLAHPERLASQLNYYINDSQMDIVGSVVSIFDDQGSALRGGYAHYERWLNAVKTPNETRRHFFVECVLAHPTFFTSKALINTLGGYQDHQWPEDYDLLARAFVQGANIGKPDSMPLLRWRDHGARLSRNSQDYQKKAFIRCKAHYLAQTLKQLHTRTVSLWGAGPTGLNWHDALVKNGIQVSDFYDINPKLKQVKKRNLPVHVAELPLHADRLPEPGKLTLITISHRGGADQMEQLFLKAGRMPYRDFLRVS